MATERNTRTINLPEIEERERAVEISSPATTNFGATQDNITQKPTALTTGRYGTPHESFSTTGGNRKIDQGPLFDSMHFKVEGPASAVFDRICNFMENLDNCDFETLPNDTKVQGCYFALPRYIQFRLGVRQSHVDPTQFVVEAQRRDGDAWLMSVVYNQLRRNFVQQSEDESNEYSPSSEREITETESVDIHTIDVSQSSEDVLHWVQFLNSASLETVQSGASVLALAAQSENNVSYLLAETDNIIKGIHTTLDLTEDKLTIYSCANLLACLTKDETFSQSCGGHAIFKSMLDVIYKWSGLNNQKRHLKSQQIFNQITLALLRVREAMGDTAFFQICNIDDHVPSIVNLQEQLGQFPEPQQEALISILNLTK